MWTFSDILVEKKKTRLSARAALLFVDLYSAGGSFACGMTFLLLAGAFSGLSLTFAPRPRGNACHLPAFPLYLPYYHTEGGTDLL